MTRDYAALLDELQQGAVDPTRFSHRDHVGVAFVALQEFGFFDGLAVVARGLRDLATCAGAPEKFNATVTLAFVSLIGERMQSDNARDAEAFILANPDLLDRDVLKPWYSAGRLSSQRARRTGLLPDRTPVVLGNCAHETARPRRSKPAIAAH